MTDSGSTSTAAHSSPQRGSSPYATGGGGVTLERRVAVLYLARLITGMTGPGLGGRQVTRVAFQQAPEHHVDDLLITSGDENGARPLALSIGVRRAPQFTSSDEDTQKLLGDLITDLRATGDGGAERRLAICVAGRQPNADQVAQLADLARQQATAVGFFALVRTPGRYQYAVSARLEHLLRLVTACLSTDEATASPEDAQEMTWRLLVHLDILRPRVESPDEADWDELLAQLQPWAREATPVAATVLRDRLETLAARYAPSAADVDATTVRRAAHDVLHNHHRRRAAAWARLRALDADARGAVRASIGPGSTGSAGFTEPNMHIVRNDAAAIIRATFTRVPPVQAVFVTGESGVGKSALVLGELAAVTASEPQTVDGLCLSLRSLPATPAELRGMLDAPLEELLAEMSAPTRLLVLDGADAVIERDDHILRYLLRAARSAGITPWVIAATDGRTAVQTILQESLQEIHELPIGGLEDSELAQVAQAFPRVRRLLDEPRAKELLRRPVVIDLLVRSGDGELPLSEAHALQAIWAGLVRANGSTLHGLPAARDQVMRRLATQQLRNTDAAALYDSLDPAAVDGLMRDGLLRQGDDWRPLPAFAHDLLRTYALTQVLLSTGDPVAELLAQGAPRWALPATRLALQVLLDAPDAPALPMTGRLARVQTAADALTTAGHGQRWSDLPTEALLTLPGAAHLLADAWPNLLADDATGLQRLLRILTQRHGRAYSLDRLAAEPVVTLVVERGWPVTLSEQVTELFCAWLRTLVLMDAPAGHPVRVALRSRLAAVVAAGDEGLVRRAEEQAAQLAARTPAEVAADEEHQRRVDALTRASRNPEEPRRRWQELPHELLDDGLLEQLALLGHDLGEEGETMLRRVATDCPHDLDAAVEAPLAGLSLSAYSIALLIELIEAYYIDDRDDDAFHGMGDEGIRHHRSQGFAMPLAASWRGPFLALFRRDLRAGAACLNRILNHAARARVRSMRQPLWDEPAEPNGRYVTELEIDGQRRAYVGDGHVWLWYRGTGVGPYPCMSALAALELVCDEYLAAGASSVVLARLLLDNCQSLAMPALVVGMLVRHLETAGTQLDAFLAEPEVWSMEFNRVVNESAGFAFRTEGVAAPGRRGWSLREASIALVLDADEQRTEELRAVGQRLIDRAVEVEGLDSESDLSPEQLDVVRGWARSLNRANYMFTPTDDGVIVEVVSDPEAAPRREAWNADFARGAEATRLVMRYPERFSRRTEQDSTQDGERSIDQEALLADLALARDLIENPPTAGSYNPYDAAAAVAAAALEGCFTAAIEVSLEDLGWAARFLVGAVNARADRGMSGEDSTVFGRGFTEAAARALPLLALPAAESLRENLVEDEEWEPAVARAIQWIIRYASNETRLFFARALDPLWATACGASEDGCNHPGALALIEDMARDCLIGGWDPEQQRNARLHIDGPVISRLTTIEDEHIDVPRLTPVIRGAAAAAASAACCSTEAADLLTAALAAHRRGMRTRRWGHQHSSNDAAAAARAVLELAATGDPTLLFTHLEGYADAPRLLSEFLRALSAAAEESPTRAAAAQTIWSAVLDRVVNLVESGACVRSNRDFGEDPLSAAIPVPSYDIGYLHREFEGAAISWWDVETLAPQMPRWLPLAAGRRESVDALARSLDLLPIDRQAVLGLPWMEQLVLDAPEAIASRSYMLPEWLAKVRRHATSPVVEAAWHRIVDALTVAGDQRIAELAD